MLVSSGVVTVFRRPCGVMSDTLAAPSARFVRTDSCAKDRMTKDAPALIGKLDADPQIRQAVLARMQGDAEIAAQTGQPIRPISSVPARSSLRTASPGCSRL